MTFAPPPTLTIAFCLLTAALLAALVWLVGRAAPAGRGGAWTTRATAAAIAWLAVHAGLASSGLLEGDGLPPPVLFYFAPTMLIGVAVALSPVGRALAGLPLAWLVGLQAFRLPLEVILHGLYDAGALPVQMTWSGYNFDVATGISAAALGLIAWRRPLPTGLVRLWNMAGIALLFVVVTIAITSLPTPLRQFTNDPPVLLPFHAPFNWIVGVHVWTALVGHLVIFRALAIRKRAAEPPEHAAA